jgi:hypothetical protein
MHAGLGLPLKQGSGRANGQNGLTWQAFCAWIGLLCQTALDLIVETFSTFLRCGLRRGPGLRDAVLAFDNDVEVI